MGHVGQFLAPATRRLPSPESANFLEKVGAQFLSLRHLVRLNRQFGWVERETSDVSAPCPDARDELARLRARKRHWLEPNTPRFSRACCASSLGKYESQSLRRADCVEELDGYGGCVLLEPCVSEGEVGQAASQVGIGLGTGTSIASFLRFWAVAASRNSSRAPHGPRRRSRSSRRMRFRCANSISTFFRSRREVSVGVGPWLCRAPHRGRLRGLSAGPCARACSDSSAASVHRRRSRICWRDRAASRRRSPGCRS